MIITHRRFYALTQLINKCCNAVSSLIGRRLLMMKRYLFILLVVLFPFWAKAQWTEVKKVTALERTTGEQFGEAVAVSGDYAVSATSKKDSVFLYQRDPSTGAWNFLKNLNASDATRARELHGRSVAIDGDYIAIGATDAKVSGLSTGAVYVYKKDQGGINNWGEVKKVVASDGALNDKFGTSVSLSGDYLIVGSPLESPPVGGGAPVNGAGSAYIFKKDQGGTDNWGQVKKVFANDGATGDNFGISVSISGEYAIIGAYRHLLNFNQEGAAYVFKKDQGGTDNWGQLKKINSTNTNTGENFGIAVAISGDHAIVGANKRSSDGNGNNQKSLGGAAFIFSRDQGGTDNWGLVKGITSADREPQDEFGIAVAISGSTAAVGAFGEDEDQNGSNELSSPGSVYVFLKDEGGLDAWGQSDKLVASDRSSGARFGNAVSVADNHLVIGAFRETDNSGATSIAQTGAAYILEGKQVQTINFPTLTSKTYGDDPFTISASSSAGLAVTFSSADPTIASLNGDQLTIHRAGTVEITALQAGNGSYLAASATQQFTIGKATLVVDVQSENRVYGEVNPVFSYVYTGFIGPDDATSLTVEPIVGSTATQFSDAGVYAISASGGLADNYDFSYVDGSLDISKAVLNVTPDDHSKYYGDENPAFTITYAGFVGGEDESVLDTAPTVITTADATSVVGTYDLTISGGVDGNYEFQGLQGTLNVDPAPLTIMAEDQSITYGEAIPTLRVSYSGFVNGEDESVLSSSSALSTTADNSSGVGDYTVVVSGATAANYDITQENGILTIDPAPLTVTADDQNKTYGDSNPTFTLTYEGFQNGEDASVLTNTPAAGTIADENSNVGSYVITLAGGSGDNYTLSYIEGTLTVNQATLTVTAEDQAKTYGQENPTLSVLYDGFQNGDDVSDLATAPEVNTSADETSDVGAYSITPSGGVADNYTFTYVDGTLTIDQATLTVTAEDEAKTYGQDNPTLNVLYDGFQNGDDVSDLATAPEVNTSADETSDVGSYSITPSGGVADNYTFTYVDGTLTIDQATLTVTAEDEAKTYGQDNPTLNVLYDGFQNGDDVSDLATAPEVNTSADETSDVGSYSITPSGGVADNYTFTYVDGTLTIDLAMLTVTAEDEAKTYGQENPILNVLYDGFQNGDDVSDLATAPEANTSADETSDVGTYSITPSGGVADNYTFTYVDGTLTIDQATLTVTAEDEAKTYGQDNPTLIVLYDGFQNGDDVSDLVTAPEANTAADETSDVGSYSITPAGGVADNYAFTYVNGTLTIDQAMLTVTAENKTRTYGEANPIITLSYSGFQNGDDRTVLDTAPEGNTSATATSNVGDYEIIPADGTDNNYAFDYVNGTLTIEQATLTVTAENQSRTYGGSNPELTITYLGFVNDDDSDALTSIPIVSTLADTSSPVGDYALNVSGGEAINYAFQYVEGTLSVLQATLMVTPNDQSKVYGAANPEFSLNYVGFVHEEDVAVLESVPQGTTVADETSLVGTYVISSSGGQDDNYSFVYNEGELTVRPAVLTILANDQSVSYGDVIPSLNVTYSGFVNGEDQTVLTTLPAVSTTASSTSPVGSYEINVTDAVADNYTIMSLTGTLTIGQAGLIITANDQSRVFGETNPELTLTYSGFVNDEDASLLITAPTVSTEADETTAPGTYAIEVRGSEATNYEITHVEGTLNVEKAPQEISFDPLPEKTTNDEGFDLVAASSSGLEINYSSSNEAVATVSGNTVTILGAGSTTITASQSGNGNYHPAEEVSHELIVIQSNDTRITSSILIQHIEHQITGSDPLTLVADTRPAEVPVDWEIISGPATIDGNILSLGAQPGLVRVKGSIKETDDYKGSEDVVTFALLDEELVTPIIDFILPAEALNSESVTLSASIDPQGTTTVSDADVAYMVISGPGEISDSNVLSFTDVGRVIVSASLPATQETNAISSQSSVEVIALYNLSGNILDDSGAPFNDGIVVVRDLNDLTNSQSVELEEEGSYNFSSLKSGDYELFVSSFSSDYATTFYGDVSPAIDPDTEPLGINMTRNLSGIDVVMRPVPNSSVEFLSEEEGGTLSFLAQNDQDNGNRIALGRIDKGEPLPNTLVILKKASDEYVAADVTNAFGLIAFKGLPTGEYKLSVDIPGAGLMSAVLGVIEGETLDVTAFIDETGAIFEVEEVLSTIRESYQLHVYPNPARHTFKIECSNPVIQVRLYNQDGRMIRRFSGREEYEIDELPEGKYLIQVFTENEMKTLRLLKY